MSQAVYLGVLCVDKKVSKSTGFKSLWHFSLSETLGRFENRAATLIPLSKVKFGWEKISKVQSHFGID